MSRTSRTIAVAVTALGLVPAAANAAEVRLSNGRVIVTASSGEVNDVKLTHAITSGAGAGLVERVVVEEVGTAPLIARAGCGQVAARKVQCEVIGQSTWKVHANLGDGNDRLVSHLGAYDIVADVDAYLGTGNDLYDSTAAQTGSTDYVSAGAGFDVVHSGKQQDVVYGGDDSDRIFGGDGIDLVFGEFGNDKIDGDLGDDELYGGYDNDLIGQLVTQMQCSSTGALGGFSNCAPELVFASDPVPDGNDRLSGGDGDDRLSVFDHTIDPAPTCGYGTDTVEHDPSEFLRPPSCETAITRN